MGLVSSVPLLSGNLSECTYSLKFYLDILTGNREHPVPPYLSLHDPTFLIEVYSHVWKFGYLHVGIQTTLLALFPDICITSLSLSLSLHARIC